MTTPIRPSEATLVEVRQALMRIEMNRRTGPQHNLTATEDWTVNADETAGYSAGSLWMNTVSDILYVCKDATRGAAIWANAFDGNETAGAGEVAGTGFNYAIVNPSTGDSVTASSKGDTLNLTGSGGLAVTGDGNSTITIAGAASSHTHDHGTDITGRDDDDHTLYSLVAGTRAFTGTVGGITPVANADLTTKRYVDDLVIPVDYVPDNINVATGGTDAGDVDSLATLDDGNSLDVSEVTGTPGFNIEINFAGVTEIPTRLDLHTYYDGNAAHTVNVQIYDQVEAGWDTLGTIPDNGTGFAYRTYDITNGSKYVKGDDTVEVRIYHLDSGNANHDIFIDLVLLRKIPTGGGGGVTDHGHLGGLTDYEDHPGFLLIDGSRAMTDALNMGGQAITNVGNVDGVDISGHVADTIDPHGSTMTVSVLLNTPRIRATNVDLNLEAKDASQHSTVFIKNPDLTFEADLNVEKDIIVGGLVDGINIADTVVTADANLTDDALVRGKGGALGAQTSVVALTDAGVMSGLTQLTIGIGAAGVDYTLTFDGENSDGTITYRENVAQFLFDQNVQMLGSLQVSSTIIASGGIQMGSHLDLKGYDIKDTTRAYVRVDDQLYVTGPIGVGTLPTSSIQFASNPSGPNINMSLYGGVTYTGTGSAAYGLLFVATHGKTDPGGNQYIYGAWITSENQGQAAANRDMFCYGAYLKAEISGAQDQATADTRAHGLYIASTEAGSGANGAGNFYGYGLRVEDTTVPGGSTTTNQEWCALFEGDTQHNGKIIVDGSTTVKGDSYIVWNAGNSHIEFWIDGVLEGYVDGAGFNNA